MRRATMLLALFLCGCLTPPEAPPPDPTESARPEPLVLHSEGAESETEWYARTFSYEGAENRPGAGEWHRSARAARSGSLGWTFQDESAGRYHDVATYDLHAPPVDLTGSEQPVLRFYFRGESENQSGDEFAWGLLVEGNIEPFGSTDAPSPGWTEVVVDLSEQRGGAVELMFRFEADWCGGDTPIAPACGEGSFEGYFVDDIEILDLGRVA